jgi:hypothetical protein
MKKSYILFLFLLVVKTALYAQSEFSQIEVKIKNPSDAYPAADSSGHLAYIFQSSKQYQFSFLNADHTNTSVLVMRNPNDRQDKIIGSMMDNGIATVYLLNKKLKSISALVVDKTGSTGTYIKLITLKSGEEYMSAVNMGGRFYILTVPKYKNELRIYTLLNGSNIETVDYNIEMPSFYAKLSTNNNNLNGQAASSVGVEEIKYSPENNIKSSYPDKKFYYFNNKMFFTFDEPGCTHLIEVDPFSHRSTYKKMNFSLERGNNSRDKQGNSFMLDNRLFRGTVSSDQMNLSILDLDSMQLINSYNFYPETDIDINNGPIVQEGGGVTSYSVDNERILKKPEQYFRKVLSGNFAVAANKIDSGKYEVELGAYEEIVTTRGGPGYGGPAISIGIGMGGAMIGGGGMGMGGFGYPMYSGYGYPGSYGGFSGYYPYSGGGGSTRMRVVYFKTLLDRYEFKHMEGEVPKTLRESINDYEATNFKNSSPENVRITPHSDKLLLGYYQRTKKKYKIVEFKKP